LTAGRARRRLVRRGARPRPRPSSAGRLTSREGPSRPTSRLRALRHRRHLRRLLSLPLRLPLRLRRARRRRRPPPITPPRRRHRLLRRRQSSARPRATQSSSVRRLRPRCCSAVFSGPAGAAASRVSLRVAIPHERAWRARSLGPGHLRRWPRRIRAGRPSRRRLVSPLSYRRPMSRPLIPAPATISSRLQPSRPGLSRCSTPTSTRARNGNGPPASQPHPPSIRRRSLRRRRPTEGPESRLWSPQRLLAPR